jgi:hypothetical protein
METPNNEEKLDLNDISFDDIVSADTDSIDTLEVLDETDTSIKETKPEAVELDKTSAENELDEDASKAVTEDTDIIEPTDKDDVDKEEIEDGLEAIEKENAEPESKETDEKSVVGEVLESLGFEGEYDYEDTPEGLKTLTLDVANKLAEEQLDNIMENFPLVQRHLEYVMNGGQSENFMRANDPQSDYGKLELTEKDTPMQKVVLSNYFRAKGHDDGMIKELIEDYEDSGKLFAKAELAKNALTDAQKKQREYMLQQQKEQNIKAREEEQKFWTGIHKTIQETNEFAGITIPNREKNKFFKYISTPVNKNGHTQSMIDRQGASQEQRLLMDYLMFKGLNLKDIIATKAKSQQTRSLKDRITKASKTTLKSAKKKTKAKTNLDLNDLDFGSLMS